MSISAGVSSPEQWIRAQTLATPVTASDGVPARTLYEGQTVANATTYQARVNIAGASSVRVRFRASVAGTLKLTFLRPDGVTKYASGNPTDVSVSANVETLIDTNAVYGEAWALIEFVAGGSGTVALCDVMAL